MNKIFKIVFNAARGKMMVVNEATSSVQTGKKAAVTVAVVGALASSVAMASIETTVDGVAQTVGEVDVGRSYQVIGFTDFPTDASQIDLSVKDYTATNNSRVVGVFLNRANDKVTDINNDLTINVTAQNNNNKVQDIRGFTQTGNAGTLTTFHQNATINVSALKGGAPAAVNSGQFANALNVDNASKVVFAGDETKLSTTHMGYTAQAAIAWNGSTVEFTGENVEIHAKGDVGANGFGTQNNSSGGKYTNTDVSTYKFDNSGDVNVNIEVLDDLDAAKKSNAIGFHGNSYSHLVVTDNVNKFAISVTGSGTDGTGVGAANGTAALYTYGEVDIDAEQFAVTVVAGEKEGHAKSYGIHA